jgi:hypothetical protein
MVCTKAIYFVSILVAAALYCFGNGAEEVALLETSDSQKADVPGNSLRIKGNDLKGLATEFLYERHMTNWCLIGYLSMSNRTKTPISVDLPVDFSFLAQLTADNREIIPFAFKSKDRSGNIQEGIIKAGFPDTETVTVPPEATVTRKIVIFVDLVFSLEPQNVYCISLVLPGNREQAWMRSSFTFRYTSPEVIYNDDETPFEKIVKRNAERKRRAK